MNVRSRRNSPRVHDASAGSLHVSGHPRVRPEQSVWVVRACRSLEVWRLSKQAARRDSWGLFGMCVYVCMCVNNTVNQTRVTDMWRVASRSRVLLQ